MKFRTNFWWLYFFCVIITFVSGAAVKSNVDVDEQGLYRKSDQVEVLTIRNFERKIYYQNHAMLVQFYNSYCGHCRAFAPKFKDLALQLKNWAKIIKLGVVDCSVEENNEICRQFEVMAYPTLRYIHENYNKANGNIGEKITPTDTAERLKSLLIYKLQSEQVLGRLAFAPSFSIGAYTSFSNAIKDVPTNVVCTFLVFENANSTLGSAIALDLNEYKDLYVKRVYEASELAQVAGVNEFPAIVAVKSTLDTTNITPTKKDEKSFLKAVSAYLISKNYRFQKEKVEEDYNKSNEKVDVIRPAVVTSDVVYYSDLEKTLKNCLHTEITRYKILTAEALQALLNYLDVIITSFPFRGNLKEYIVALRNTLASRDSWSGGDVYDTVKSLEESYAPVYTSNLEYIGCKGSLPQYRGYSCGLWTLFHTLTVNAARKPGNEGPKVLRAMLGYIKHFFGCTECAEHFQAMAERNRIFDVKENDKAVLWLWISHNEVNLRLAGDITEDPEYPKIQFPSVSKCAKCRLARGAWNLPAVYAYLQNMYGAENIREPRVARSSAAASSPFSSLDIGMLSLLYIFSFVILILVIKYFLTKRFYRKRPYKHGRGKV